MTVGLVSNLKSWAQEKCRKAKKFLEPKPAFRLKDLGPDLTKLIMGFSKGETLAMMRGVNRSFCNMTANPSYQLRIASAKKEKKELTGVDAIMQEAEDLERAEMEQQARDVEASRRETAASKVINSK